MPLFIDESGNTGPVLTPPDRRFFLAGVWFPSSDGAEAFTQAVIGLRRTLRLKETFEFKFSSTGQHPQRRRAFYETALEHQFRFAVAWVDKRLDGLAGNKPGVHACVGIRLAESFCPLLLEHYPPPPLGAKKHQPPKERVWVDDNKDENFLTIVRDTFRSIGELDTPTRQVVGQVKFAKSAPSSLLQLADMVCGGYRAFVEDGEREWYRLIRERDLGQQPVCGPLP